MNAALPARRRFLVEGAQMSAAAAGVGVLWYALVRSEARAAANALRPPGALAEPDFGGRCLKCGQCVRACPYHTLKLASMAGQVAVGTPYYEPRAVPCYMCTTLPCTQACPSGALDRALTDVTRARMGVAVIDEEHCLSWQGMRCEVCYRVCPVRGKAIRIQTEPRRTSRHAVFEPVVDSTQCTGCGLCEHACPTEAAAIRVLRPEFVLGRIGGHYRMQERAVPEPVNGGEAAAVSPVGPNAGGTPSVPAPPAVAVPGPAVSPPAAAVPGPGVSPRPPSALDWLNSKEPL